MARLKALLHEDPRREARALEKLQAQQRAVRHFQRNDARTAPDDGRGGSGYWV